MAVGRMTLGAKCAGFKKEPNLTKELQLLTYKLPRPIETGTTPCL